jgi:polyferredoxin
MYEELAATLLALITGIGLAFAGILVILIYKKDRTKKLTYLRLFVQLASLVGIFYSFTMALWLSVFFLVILVATLFTGRFFCGWMCPFGFYMDLVALVRQAFKIRYRLLPDKVNRALHSLRYVIAAVFLVLPLFLGALAGGPGSQTYALFLRGPYKPIGLFLDPLEPLVVPFTGSLYNFGFVDWSLSYPYVRDIAYYINIPLLASVVVYLFIGLTLAGTFMYRRLWCRFCPTGISLAAINRFKAFKGVPLLHLHKSEEKCTKCGICKRVCPVQVTEVYEQKSGDLNKSNCMLCLRCVEMCPYEGCLSVKLAQKTVFQSRNWLEPSKPE